MWHSATLSNNSIKLTSLQVGVVQIFCFPSVDIHLNTPHLYRRGAVRRKKGIQMNVGNTLIKEEIGG